MSFQGALKILIIPVFQFLKSTVATVIEKLFSLKNVMTSEQE